MCRCYASSTRGCSSTTSCAGAGCGDSVVAALALANQRGLSPQDTMILATATGSANAMMTGTQPAPAQLVVELQPRVELA